VMKLALSPMVDELVRAVSLLQRSEQVSEDHRIRESLNG
jgi:hypothetical protein